MSLTTHRGAAEASGAQGHAGTFETAASDALCALRDAAVTAIESIGGGNMNSLALSRRLGVDKSLTWRMVRFAQEPDAFSGSKHLPGDAGLRIFARAVRAHGADEATVERFTAAADRLEEVVRQHAGNRASFRALLAHCTAEPHADERAMDFRRSAHQANAALWGIEASTRLMLAFLTPGANGTVDVALVSGFLGLRRMRRDQSWPVARRRVLGHEGRTRERIVMPLDPSVPMDAPPILAEFSTLRGEALRPMGTEHGFWYELPEGDVGTGGAVDCVFGERMPGAGPCVREGGVHGAEVLLRLDMPVEHVLMDVFVDRSLPVAGAPKASLYGLLSGGSGENCADRERDRMPLAEQPQEIGQEPRAWATPVAPRHWELIHDCMRWIDRRPTDFRAHRLAMRWPLIPTALVVSTPIGTR